MSRVVDVGSLRLHGRSKIILIFVVNQPQVFGLPFTGGSLH